MKEEVCKHVIGLSFIKHRERTRKFREKGNLKPLFRSELDKACFSHDAVYSDSKDAAKRTISDKILKDRTYEIDKKTGSGISVHEQLAEELHKLVIKKL